MSGRAGQLSRALHVIRQRAMWWNDHGALCCCMECVMVRFRERERSREAVRRHRACERGWRNSMSNVDGRSQDIAILTTTFGYVKKY